MNDEIIKLREETGAGVMDCKRALQKAENNYTKALQFIREQGLAKASKRQEKETGAGLLEAYVHNQRIGVLLEVRSETDFVAHSDPVKKFTHQVAMHVVAMSPETVEDLVKQPFIYNEAETVEDELKQIIAQVGENIKINRFTRYEL